MALATYTNLNVTSDVVTMSAIDTCVGSAPTDRNSVLTPAGGYVAVPVASDYGVNTVAAVRPKCFEPPSYSATIDPGLMTSG